MKFFDNQLRRINSKGALIGAKRGANTNIARFVFDVERYGNEAAISSLRWNKQTTDELDRLVRDLRAANIEGEDLDSLMFYAATSTDDEILNNPALARWVGQGADGLQRSVRLLLRLVSGGSRLVVGQASLRTRSTTSSMRHACVTTLSSSVVPPA